MKTPQAVALATAVSLAAGSGATYLVVRRRLAQPAQELERLRDELADREARIRQLEVELRQAQSAQAQAEAARAKAAEEATQLRRQLDDCLKRPTAPAPIPTPMVPGPAPSAVLVRLEAQTWFGAARSFVLDRPTRVRVTYQLRYVAIYEMGIGRCIAVQHIAILRPIGGPILFSSEPSPVRRFCNGPHQYLTKSGSSPVLDLPPGEYRLEIAVFGQWPVPFGRSVAEVQVA